MTAILEQIRQLEAARARGDLTDEAFAAAKARLMASIEDANEAITIQPQPKAPPVSRSNAWEIVLFSLFALVCLTGIVALLLGDLTLALTISVTVLAAITVRAFRTLED